jgi:predicted nucleic acid-binding protein
MTFVFDTNILLHYVRESDVMKMVESQFDPFGNGQETWISAVSIGEIYAIAMQNKWGNKRLLKLLVLHK